MHDNNAQQVLLRILIGIPKVAAGLKRKESETSSVDSLKPTISKLKIVAQVRDDKFSIQPPA
jgi:hypothetical protein